MTKINVFIVQMSHRVRLSLFVYEVVTNMTAVNLEDISHFKKEFMNQCCVYTILQKSVIVGLHKNNNTICISVFFFLYCFFKDQSHIQFKFVCFFLCECISRISVHCRMRAQL